MKNLSLNSEEARFHTLSASLEVFSCVPCQEGLTPRTNVVLHLCLSLCLLQPHSWDHFLPLHFDPCQWCSCNHYFLFFCNHVFIYSGIVFWISHCHQAYCCNAYSHIKPCWNKVRLLSPKGDCIHTGLFRILLNAKHVKSTVFSTGLVQSVCSDFKLKHKYRLGRSRGRIRFC